MIAQSLVEKLGVSVGIGDGAEPLGKLLSVGKKPRQRGLSIAKLIEQYLDHADSYYRNSDGTPTGEPTSLRHALRVLRESFGRTRADEFRPLKLKAVRDKMVERGWCRRHVNEQVGRIRRMFKWAVENELLPSDRYHALQAVPGLKMGRTTAPEGRRVKPVALELVEAVLPFVSKQVAAMIHLQLLTGMRPGEVCIMRTGDIDRSASVWLYRPSRHKTQHHSHDRVVFLGPQAQQVVQPFLKNTEAERYIFSAAEAREAFRHPQFSLPRRIETIVPMPILGVESLDLSIVDTRGIDETSVPRRDLQAYIDDPRTLVVLASGFGDAPNPATQALIERSAQSGIESPLKGKAMVLVLPRGTEERDVQDRSSGKAVGSEELGRAIRADEVLGTLHHLNAAFMPVQFLNVQRPEDCASVSTAIAEMVMDMRRRYERQIEELVETVEHIKKNKANKRTRAVFAAALADVNDWFGGVREPEGQLEELVPARLLEEMSKVHHATVRASVSRKGNWYRFDYWHSLGWGARHDAVLRTTEQLTVLRSRIRKAIENSAWAEAHGFLNHFLNQVESSSTQFYQQVQRIGEMAFLEQLRTDDGYWTRCSRRWGTHVPGYKATIQNWTEDWFKDSQSSRRERYAFIEAEVRRLWNEMIDALRSQLSTTDVQAATEAVQKA